MSWLDDILGTVFRVNGAEVVTRRIVDFVAGPNVTLTQVDDSNSEKTVISIGAGSGIGGVVTALLAGLAPSFTAGTQGILKTDGTTPSWSRVTAALCGPDTVVASLAGPALSGWSVNATTGDLQQDSVAAAGSVALPVQGLVGRIVGSVSVALVGATHSALPVTMPKVRFERRSIASGAAPGAWALVDGFAEATDAATLANYQLVHSVTVTGSAGHTIAAGYQYRLVVYGETGQNSVVGLRVLSVAWGLL